MKISNNHALIQRNKKISQFVLFFSLALLILGVLWSLTSPTVTQTTFSYVILIPAYLLVQISIYMANRWGRSPRPDEIVVQSLKGLPDQYTLYNYNAGVPHLLVGPAGLWIIKPYHQSGEISFNEEKNRYDQRGGANFISKLFAQEGLTNIAKDTKTYLRQFNNHIQRNQIALDASPKIINIFYSEKAYVIARNAPEPTMHSSKLKEYIRSQAKQKNLSDVEIKKITKFLPEPQ